MTASCHRKRLEGVPEGFGRDVLTRLRPGPEIRKVDYAAALRWLEGWRHEVACLIAGRFDAVLTPTTPVWRRRLGRMK